MGFSPDGRPVVGRVPDHPEGLFATGFTGHGMGYGFRMGRLLADLLCEAEQPEAFKLFAASRFGNSAEEGSKTGSQPSRTADS